MSDSEQTAFNGVVFYHEGVEVLRLAWPQVIEAIENLLYPTRTVTNHPVEWDYKPYCNDFG